MIRKYYYFIIPLNFLKMMHILVKDCKTYYLPKYDKLKEYMGQKCSFRL